jgi:ABC-type sugar transport system ATPase subunit
LWRWALPAERKRELAARRIAIAQRVRETARALGIEGLLDRLPRQLSGGERQRVALGRAIVRDPAVFLFDEPLSNLDAKLRVEMRRELRQLHQRLGATMIYVTHDQVEALTLGDRIAVMNDGKVQQLGPPMEVYDWPANRFVAGFIGTPAMNFIDGQIDDSAGLAFRRGPCRVSLAGRSLDDAARGGQDVVLGIRPDDVQISGPEAAAGLAATVELTEMLGDATVATLRVGAAGPTDGGGKTHQQTDFYVTSKTDPRADLRPGMAVSVRLDEDRIHLFDPQTGNNWVRQPAAG